jgi:hypothetical protein
MLNVIRKMLRQISKVTPYMGLKISGLSRTEVFVEPWVEANSRYSSLLALYGAF